ncbi:MAG: hypothetical protein J5X21_08000 [Candidatus Accumulibacter sp.]|nr:hypothetical protein [Candidatus Accumulibacter conexus]
MMRAAKARLNPLKADGLIVTTFLCRSHGRPADPVHCGSGWRHGGAAGAGASAAPAPPADGAPIRDAWRDAAGA